MQKTTAQSVKLRMIDYKVKVWRGGKGEYVVSVVDDVTDDCKFNRILLQSVLTSSTRKPEFFLHRLLSTDALYTDRRRSTSCGIQIFRNVLLYTVNLDENLATIICLSKIAKVLSISSSLVQSMSYAGDRHAINLYKKLVQVSCTRNLHQFFMQVSCTMLQRQTPGITDRSPSDLRRQQSVSSRCLLCFVTTCDPSATAPAACR